MDFLTAPTDNLYKFIAIAGIVLAVSASLFIDKALDNLGDQSRKLKLDNLVLQNKALQDVAELDETTKSLKAVEGLDKDSSEYVEELTKMNTQFKNDADKAVHDKNSAAKLEKEQKDLDALDAKLKANNVIISSRLYWRVVARGWKQRGKVDFFRRFDG